MLKRGMQALFEQWGPAAGAGAFAVHVGVESREKAVGALVPPQGGARISLGQGLGEGYTYGAYWHLCFSRKN